MNARHRLRQRLPVRRSFTLTELLVVVMIISLLASSVMFAMWGAIEDARAARTRAQISKLNELVMGRHETYRTRAVRLNLPPLARRQGRTAAIARLNALRDLMRMELPDRKTDVVDPPVTIPVTYGTPAVTANVSLAIPSVLREYRRRAQQGTGNYNAWTEQHQDSECLYMIIASIRDLDSNGLDFLQDGEIGDLDEDGMPEILDAWGRPIAFLRWPAGFVVHPGEDLDWGVKTINDDGLGATDDFAEAGWPGSDDVPYQGDLQLIVLDATAADYIAPEVRDPFDPLQLDKRPGVLMFASNSQAKYYFNFALYPLICSSGPDQLMDLVRFDYVDSAPEVEIPFSYFRGVANPVQNDPYSVLPNCGRRLGEPFWQSFGYADNVHNHALGGQ